jgi:hypothetical protein
VLPQASSPDDPLAFIKACIVSGRIRWSYHVTMRLKQRKLTAQVLSDSMASLDLMESYPDDKYLPSFLLRGVVEGLVFHALIATDVEGDNVRVVTMYLPDPNKWDVAGRKRRSLT